MGGQGSELVRSLCGSKLPCHDFGPCRLALASMAVTTQLVVMSWLPCVMAGWYIGRRGQRESCSHVCNGIGPCNEKALSDIMSCQPEKLKTFLGSVAAVRDVLGSLSNHDCSKGMALLNSSTAIATPFADAKGQCGYTVDRTATCDSQPPFGDSVRHCCCEEYIGDCEVDTSDCPESFSDSTSVISTTSSIAHLRLDEWFGATEPPTPRNGISPEHPTLVIILAAALGVAGFVFCICCLMFSITLCRLPEMGLLAAFGCADFLTKLSLVMSWEKLRSPNQA